MYQNNKINHRLSFKEKTKLDEFGDPIYGKLVLNSLDNDYHYLSADYYHKMAKNYNSYANKLDLLEYINYFDLDNDDALLKKLQNFDLINTKINSLREELMARPINFNAVATNPNANNMRLDYLNQLTVEHVDNLIRMINAKVKREDLAAYNQKELKRLSGILKSYKIKGEIEANNILKYVLLQNNLKYIFGEGFLDALLVAIECYWVGVRNNNMVVERLNPLRLRFMLPPDITDIKHSSWATYEYHITTGEAYDWFHSFLKEEDSNIINSTIATNSFNFSSNLGFKSSYINTTMNIPQDNRSIDNFFGDYDVITTMLPTFTSSLNEGLVRVLYAEWESLKEQKIVHRYTDKYGEEKDIVESDYKLDKTVGDKKVESFWTKEIWQGYKVGNKYINTSGNCLYLDVKPKDVQHTSLRNPNKAYCGFIGKIYNSVNSEPTPIYDKALPAQKMYNMLMLQIERLITSEIGRAVMIDPKAIPEDMDYESFNAILKTFKMMPIDTSKTNGSTPFGQVDLSMASNAISERMQWLGYYKNEVVEILGVSRERVGQIQNGTNVSDNQANIQNSRTVTEGEFRQHDDLIRQVLTAILDVSKEHYRENPIQAVMLDNDSPLFVTAEELSLHDYDVVVANKSSERDLIRTINGLAQAMIQNGYNLSSILHIMNEDFSLGKKIAMLEELEEERKQLQQQQQEIQQKMQTEKLTHEEKLRMQEIEIKLQVQEAVNNAKLEIANMNKDLALQQINYKIEAQKYDTDKRYDVKSKEVDVLEEKNAILKEKYT
jgi:hypothetical protein